MSRSVLTGFIARSLVSDLEPQRLYDQNAVYDPSRVEAVVRKYQGYVWGLCRLNLGRDDADTDDAAQATILALYLKLHTIRDQSDAGLRSWLYTAARRACGHVRRAARRQDSVRVGLVQ